MKPTFCEKGEKILFDLINTGGDEHDYLKEVAAKTFKKIIKELQKELPKFYPVFNGYKEFEKYTNCKHKKENTLASDCQACDIFWLIRRCKHLEKSLITIHKLLKEGGMK